MSKINIDELKIGDEVYFENGVIENHKLYWVVVDKKRNNLEIEIDEMGAKDRLWISIDDVKRVIKR